MNHTTPIMFRSLHIHSTLDHVLMLSLTSQPLSLFSFTSRSNLSNSRSPNLLLLGGCRTTAYSWATLNVRIQVAAIGARFDFLLLFRS